MKISKRCDHCQIEFLRSIKDENNRARKGCIGVFCSRKCSNLAQKINNIDCICTNCNKLFIRVKSGLSKNNFCSSSCAATYNNKHKTHGTRRSKLEFYIEEQLRTDFPDLVILCNKKEYIGSELDFYFPQLYLAIELNGIFHYEPIYGQNKLDKIQNNDKQKSMRCYEVGIEFCVIDVSQCKYLSKYNKQKYYNIVKNLVAQNIGRAENTNAQVS